MAPTDGEPPEASVGSNFYGHAALIERTLVTLIGNAIKYSDNGARVTVSLEADGDDIVCAVCDTGIGTPANALATLFYRFPRIDDKRPSQARWRGTCTRPCCYRRASSSSTYKTRCNIELS
jgi:signal transduction histidine kinase